MSDAPATLILGGSGAIGSTVAKALAERGHQLLLAGRNEETLASVSDELGAETAVVDGRDVAAVRALGKDAVKRFGRLDGVVNCIGSIVLKPAHATKPEELEEIMAVNLNSAFGAVQAAADTMRKTGGAVVLLSSAAARYGLPNHEGIAAAKAAVTGLGQAAAASYASMGIRVNVVAPGLVDTPLSEGITSVPAAREASEAMHPLGRIGEPSDIASAILYLLDAPWVTGQVVGVDGGLATVKSRKG